MKPSTCTVTSMRMTSGEYGLVLEVTVQRQPEGIVFSDVPPRTADVPPDLRQALREWLDKPEDDQ